LRSGCCSNADDHTCGPAAAFGREGLQRAQQLQCWRSDESGARLRLAGSRDRLGCRERLPMRLSLTRELIPIVLIAVSTVC
jgi:hypothetical protein